MRTPSRHRRPPRVRRRLGWTWVAAVLLAGALAVADRAGLFSWPGAPAQLPDPTIAEDLARYDGKSFRVQRCVDGDTIILDATDFNGATTRVRLWGVDTPETVKPNTPPQHFGHEASEFTRAACQGQTVKIGLEPHSTRDKYHRLLAWVFLPDGKLLNRELVRLGYGYADPRFAHSRKAELADLQSRARRDRLGLWKDIHPTDLPGYLTNRPRE